MTASGSNKKRICSKRSSAALSCFFLKALQVASKSCDGLRFGSLVHKERSRMAKGMSPLRSLMRNAQRKTLADGIDGSSSGSDGTAQSTRQPLGPITDSTVRNPLITVAEQSSGDPSTPRAKAKVSSTHGDEKFPHLENSEVFATSINTTPDKTASSQSKGKFTWQHRHGPTAQNTLRDGPPPLNTPPRPPKVGGSGCSDGQSANNQDTTLQSVSHHFRGGSTTGGGSVPSTPFRGGSTTGGGSVPSTPKTGRSVGGKSTTESENGGSQSQNATPSKSVSRSLKYSQQQGSANNSGASGLTNARSTVAQHGITRPMGYLQAAKGFLPQTSNQNFVEHQFELEEDASFWRDHNVQVIIRTRPLSNSELTSQGWNRCLKQESPHVVSWLGQPESRFTFDHVAGETITQAKLFDIAGLPMVENCMSGYNSCMFAYGQTGSGKTHTMLGDMENLDLSPSENRGMTPRVFEYLFARIRTEQECRRHEHLKFFCKCSFLEIYNEQITDLLEPSSTNLQMREDAKKGVYVENLSEVEVQCVQDVIQLLLQGASNRKVAATNMNRESSRSHSVFTCVVESKWENNSMTNSRYGRLHLVDLAGSERQKSSGAEGGRLKEAANINKSLSTLGLVIMILVDVANGRQRHVPYRDSKLTFLLQDSLGGNSKTIMIANVSPASCCAMETLSTLKFAQRAKFIRNNAIINEDATGDVIALRQEIEELKVEVERLRRERMLRVSSSRILALENGSVVAGQMGGDKFDASTLDCNVIEHSNKSQTVSIANNDKQLRSIEAILAGALRREQQAEDITKKLAAEIEQLNRLVRQREEDSQCSKMLLRFREEKIRRLEGIADNVISAEAFYEEERKNLIDELQLIRGRLDRNPELTRFAMENIRLMEELRRYQEFYDGGERDVLLEEISGLRSQLLDMLDTKVGAEQTIDKLLTPQKRALVPELSALERENELLLIEVKTYQNELKECRNNLNSCLVANADLSRQVDELQATVKQLKNQRFQKYEESRELLVSLDEELQDSFFSEASLPLPQEAASSADPTTAHIRLETEEVNLQQRHAVANVEEQVLELRNQLKEAQDLIQKLSSEVEEANELSDRRKQSTPCVAEDDAVVRQGLQDRWEKLQEIEMRHSEEMTQLQLELDSMEEVMSEERQQRLAADQKIDDLSSELSTTLSKLEQAQSLAEDSSTEERQQRLVAEQRSEELSSQLSAAVTQLQLEVDSMEEVLREERQQRLAAEQKIADLSSKFSTTVSKLEQAQSLAEDSSTEERQQRLLAEKRSEELSSQLSEAVTQLQLEVDSMEELLRVERQQRLLAEQRIAELSSELSTTVSKLEQAQSLAEDSSTEERQQRLVAEQRSEELSSQLSAAVSQLQLEVDSMEELLRVERQQGLLAEQRIADLSSELSTTLSKLEQAQSLAEDSSTEERQQRLVAEQRSEELSSQLRAGVTQLQLEVDSMEELLRVERQQRLLAEQRIAELSSELSTTVSKLEQAQSLAEDSSTEERQQRLVAEQRSEELSQLSAAVTQLQLEVDSMEELLGVERQQRLAADQKIADLSSELSTTLSKLEQAQNLAEDSSLEERQQRLMAEQRIQELSRQLSAAVSKLEEAHCLVEALEGQQLFSINELENLQSEHMKLLKKMKEQEEGEDQLQKQLQDENTVDDAAVSILEQKLLRAKRGKEEARRINRQFQQDQASRMALDKERELTMSEVETQAALAITTLQSEILELREDVSVAVESEATAKLQISHLQKEVESLQRTIGELEDINRCFSDKSEEYRNLLEERNTQLQGLEVDWESSASKLIDFLSEGDEALSEAVREMEEIKQTKIQGITQMHDNHVVEKRDTAEPVDHSLQGVHGMGREEDSEVRTQSDAKATETTNFAFEDGEAMIREAEKKSMAAFLMVKELLERIKDLKSAQHRLVQETQEAFLREASKDNQAAALIQQLDELRRRYGELQAENELVIGEQEDLRQENRTKSLQLESRNDLKADCIRLEKEIQESCRAIEEKDVENRNLHRQLNENHVQSTLLSDQYQLLAAAHEKSQEEQARYLEDNALKVREWEEQVRLAERKAMAVLAVGEQLLGGRNDLKASNMSLAKEMQDGHFLLAEKQAALDTIEHKLEQSALQYKEIADQYELLAETNVNLQQEHSRLLAEAAVRVEEGEALVNLSERKAMAAFVVLKDMQERVKELQTTNTRLTMEIGEAHVTAREKDAALVSLQNELCEYSDVATRHHVLEEAHESLRQNHERLLAETALRVEEGEALVKLSERKAMAAFVVLEDLLERVKELQTRNNCLSMEIGEAHVTSGEKDSALAALQNQLSEYSDATTRHHVLEVAHENLQHDHESLLAELALRVEEGEALVNDLKASNMSLAKVIQDGRLLLAEKQAALDTIEQKLEQNALQYKEIADQYELLAETNVNLQQEHSRLLAEAAVRVEEGEALVNLSERKAMAAFVLLEDLLERVKELQTTNTCLAKEIEEGHVKLAEKNTALAALQNELSDYSDVARRHQVLHEAHENLQQDHERLLQEHVLSTVDGDQAVKLCEKRAMATLVILRQVLDGKKELQEETERQERKIQEAHVALAEKNAKFLALEQKLEQSSYQSSDIADKHQLLICAHDILREQHERLQEEFDKARERHEILEEELVKGREEQEGLRQKLEKEQEELEGLRKELVTALEDYERIVGESVLTTEEQERMIKLSEKKAMVSLILVEHVMETLEVLKVTKLTLENKIDEEHVAQSQKESRLQRQLEESQAFQKAVCDENQFLLEKQGSLQQQLAVLELGLRNSDSEVRLFEEMSVTAEQQYTAAYNEALSTMMKANSLLEMKGVESLELFMASVRDGLEVFCEEVSTVEEAVAQLGTVGRELGTCRSKVLMLEEENGRNLSAIESYQTKISQLVMALQLKERDLTVTLEKETTCNKNWEAERATLVFENEKSVRDCLESEKLVQSLLLEVQKLDSSVKEAELKISDMVTSVQVLTVAKQELDLENSRLVLAARQGETNFGEKEMHIIAIQGDLADIRARLSAAELREHSASERMEELTVATLEWEIERAVVEQELLRLREEKHKLRSQVSHLKLEMEKREISTLESFRRSQEALEVAEARMTAMDEELRSLEMSKGKLEHGMALLEAAASGDAFAVEEKELECLEMKRQLGIVVTQINQLQTAIDLAAAQFALEMSNGGMQEGKCAGDIQPREEILSADLVSTQGSLTTEVQRLESSLKLTEFRVIEMLKGVKALTVAVEELELEKSRLVLAASQADMRCTEKEEELVATQGDLAGLRSKLEEAELHEKFLCGQMEELTGAKLQWEVERADTKRVIEEMSQEKDRLRFDLSDVNAEVEERERAIFDSFRRSQQALEREEGRLITMEQEMRGLEMSQQNLEHDLALLDSAATTSSVALEEKEQKYLEMQRRVENAEGQMCEMQAFADSVMAQVVQERDNWEANKRRMKDENDARETELREEIAAAELKLVATEGSLKVAVENVEDLGLSVRALEDEILTLNEDAKISLLKVTEQQQQMETLREMSMALKAQCTEADDSIAALNQLREQYLLAEASWRSEQELLTKKLEELEVSAGQTKGEAVSNEGSGVSKNRGELSQCLTECIPRSEDQKLFDEAHQFSREKQEIQMLRAKISEKESTILSAKKEMQIAIANLKEAELEMDKVHRENHRLTQIQLENTSLIDSLSSKLKTAEEELLKQNIENEEFETELQKVVGVMSDWETDMRDVEIEWSKEKEALAQELTEAQLVANENRTEARALLQKFQDGQATLKEAANRENDRLTLIQLESTSLIDSLSLKLKTTEEELLKRDIKIEGCEIELQKVVGVMSDWETNMHDVEIEWRKEKEALAQELTEAKLVANEKRTEAGALLQKFQDGQATLKEATDLVDALVKANENAKHDALDWKTEKDSLRIVQGWWMPERDKLVSKVATLETDMHTQKQDMWIMCKEEVNGLVATMDLLLAVDKELSELKNHHQQDLDHLAFEMKALQGDLVARLLDLEGDMMSSFEDTQTVVYELTSKNRALKDLADLEVVKEQSTAASLETMNSELKAVENERDKYQSDLVVLNEQLGMAQILAEQREIVAAEEARILERTVEELERTVSALESQAAERSKSLAGQKEEEARILERSVDELERTVSALESQLDTMKQESERQRVARDALEKELKALKLEMGLMQVTLESQEAQTVRDIQGAETSKTELYRTVIEMKNQQIQARKAVESLQQECAEKEVQLRSCKAHIAELMLGAEKQASENQQKLKTLETMVEHLKVEERKVNPAGGSVSKAVEKTTGKVKGAGSPFKCIGSGLDKQRSSEMDEELSSAKKRIKELETVAASRQKEVFMLNTKLAEAESMTHDVVRDLLGVKMDIASYATLLNQQQVQQITEKARRRTMDAQQKEDELDTLRDRLNEFIEERESWLEEINRRQAEAVAARVSVEKLRLRDETLTAENDRFREDNHALRKKVADLDDEIKKLSRQQNLQQRIHHHAKIKEENNSIRVQNEDLSGKLRRMEILFTRVNDELARYRTADGKSPFLNFDEEARVQKKLQETEENRLQLAETLIGLCTGIMQAAGIQRASRDLDPSAAMMALHQLQDRLESLERELSDCKLKARIAVEKRRLSDLRDFHTPVKAICTNTNFTANQQLPSPDSSSR